MDSFRSTRAAKALSSSINVLFLHEVNPEYQVRTIEKIPKLGVGSEMRLQNLCPHIAAFVEDAFEFKVDPEKLKFFKPRNPLPISDAKAWVKKHPDIDDAQQLQYAQLLLKFLDLEKIGDDDVDLIVSGMALVVDHVEEDDVVGKLPLFGPYQRYKALQGKMKNLAPSAVVQSQAREGFQKSQCTVILDGSFALDEHGNRVIETAALPIELFYPPFGELAADFENLMLSPSERTLELAALLITKFGVIAQEQDEDVHRT
ncbi:hypothetical protein VKT23_012523 [Stygiomarasmius scandens]|uniref:Uncharacterized protein n=1 Tax=Marasmiellus scandens TaxID=2682957 RepID=A0ABR1JAU3_9AGAR